MSLLLSSTPAVLKAQVGEESPQVRQALAYIERIEPQTILDQIEICRIAAPPYKEQSRASYYRGRLETLGLRNVHIDSVGNVVGDRPGEPGARMVVLSGHLDTVFPEGTDVAVKRDGSILRGPGIADDCRGLAVLLAVAQTLDQAKVVTRRTLRFVATVGEEGEGNLRGVRYFFGTPQARDVDYFISVDGGGRQLTKDAVGSYRYAVTYRGPGGHSYGAFGRPNPIHALGRAIAKISEFQVSTEPKVTFNVGVISGGTSVNSIPFDAAMQVDMRSPDSAALEHLDSLFRSAVRAALVEENRRWNNGELTVEIDRWGLRPAGTQSLDAPVVQAAIRAATALGFAAEMVAGSTDANIPINLGVPAIAIQGGGTQGDTHALSEWFDTTNSHLGTQWLLLTALSLANAF